VAAGSASIRPITRTRTFIFCRLVSSRSSTSTKSFMSPETSSSGRDQFSEENEYSVR